MHISFGKNFRDTVPLGKELSFDKFCKLVTDLPVHVGALHWTQYALAGKQERSRDKDTRWFIPAVFVRPERRADAVSALTGFVCDFDDGAVGRAAIESFARRNGEISFIAWTSYSNGLDGKEKWRVFYPYKEPVAPEAHKAIFDWFNAEYGGHLDPRCATVSQLWYLRGRPTGAPPSHLFSVDNGSLLDAERCHGPVRPVGDGRPGGLPVGSLSALAARAADANDDLVARGPTSLIDIEGALKALDPNLYEDYTEWLNIGMAIYDGTKGSAEGLALFDGWSATCPGYGGLDNVEGKWASFGRRKGLAKITVATLFKQALAAGWGGVEPHPNVAVPVPANAGPRVQALAAASVQALPSGQPGANQPVLVTAPTPIPDTWKVSATGFGMQKVSEDPDTGRKDWSTVIRGFRALSLTLLSTIDEGGHSTELTTENASGLNIANFPTGMLAQTTEFRELLNNRGILTTDPEFKSLRELIMDWLKKIQTAQNIKRSFTHLGWMEKDGQHIGFALGDTAYYHDGTKESGIKVSNGGGSSIVKHYIPQGSLQAWSAISSFLATQNRVELMAILATSFGSPLMKFSGHSGAVVSIVSIASGVGKSTALSLAQSVWASPKAAMHSAADTTLSLSAKMGFTKDLPAYWDDIKGEKTFEQFAQTIYHITQGKEKSRLSQQADLREVQNWNCLAVVAANDSLIEIVKRYGKGTDAGAARIFEIRLEQRPAMTQGSTFFDQCSTNYGVAGEVYSAWLAANPDRARQLVESLSTRLSTQLKVESEERFWVAACATMIAGAMIAKLIGLVNFDIPGLTKFLMNRFQELRGGKTEQMKELDAGPMVSDMVLDHQQTTLRIESLPFKNKTKVMVTRAPKQGDVDILLADKDGVLRVRKAKFNEWCKLKGHSTTTLLAKLHQANAIVERNTDPMAGTPPYSAGNRTTCYDIDLKVLGIQTGDNDVDPDQPG